MCFYPISPFSLIVYLSSQREREESRLIQRFSLRKFQGGSDVSWDRRVYKGQGLLIHLFVCVIVCNGGNVKMFFFFFWKCLLNIQMEMSGKQLDRGFWELWKKMGILIWKSFYEIIYEVNINREDQRLLSQVREQLEFWMKRRIQ